jgi:hypothetical protein
MIAGNAGLTVTADAPGVNNFAVVELQAPPDRERRVRVVHLLNPDASAVWVFATAVTATLIESGLTVVTPAYASGRALAQVRHGSTATEPDLAGWARPQELAAPGAGSYSNLHAPALLLLPGEILCLVASADDQQLVAQLAWEELA